MTIPRAQRLFGAALCASIALVPKAARAQAAEPPPASAPSATPESSEGHAQTAPPKPAEPAPPVKVFTVDPILDGGIIVGAGAFAGILEAVNSTGEIRPQQIAPGFDKSKLLWIDRGAASPSSDSSAKTLSNIGLFTAMGYAVLDPILTGIREQNVRSWLVDSVIYLESFTVTSGITNLVKLAVRRPRPQAYIDAEAHKNDPNYSNTATDSALSFFSGHASTTAAMSATATYLAFARSPDSPRPWITLGVGTALTTFVSIERVNARAHFPTDVIAGALAGAGIGVVVAHLHRAAGANRRLWIGFAPDGEVTTGGLF
jgi:undecaprenyl-diphosphatase